MGIHLSGRKYNTGTGYFCDNNLVGEWDIRIKLHNFGSHFS
jgi:hypothetical protein